MLDIKDIKNRKGYYNECFKKREYGVDLDNLISEEAEEQSANYSYKQINFQHEEKYLKELKELISLLD